MTERQIKTYLSRIGFNDPNKEFFTCTILPSLKGFIPNSCDSTTSTQDLTCIVKYSCPICSELNNNKQTTKEEKSKAEKIIAQQNDVD